LVHPGEGELVVRPVALGDDGDFVVAGALERQVVIGGNVLDDRKRIVPGIDNAFEEGHAVSTLPLAEIRIRAIRTQHTGLRASRRAAAAALTDDPSRGDQGLPGRSDVICGIGATAW